MRDLFAQALVLGTALALGHLVDRQGGYDLGGT